MISLFKVFMSQDVNEPLLKTLSSGYITQGPRVEEFEQKLGEYLGNKNVLTLNSATSGLTITLRLLLNPDVRFNWPGFDKKKDIVLTPALTCFATTAAILANSVKIRWLDVDLNTANICLEDLKNKLTPNTKIIYLVHWGGYPVDLNKLSELMDYAENKFGFRPMVIEDCAHAFGAEFGGKKLSNHGNICVYSLQAIKHLSTGDGGLITLPNEYLYERAKLLRWYGIDRNRRNYKGKDFRLEHDITEWGYKFHMNDINATMGIHNLPHIDNNLEIARDNNRYYFEKLNNIPGVTLLENAIDRRGACWLFTMRVTCKLEFIDAMKEVGIMVSQVHARNDVNTCVKEYQEVLPNLDIMEKELICIPLGWWITKENREYIVNSIREYYL